MKQLIQLRMILFVACTLFAAAAMAQTSEEKSKAKTVAELKTYLIEREIPDAGKLTAAELKGVSQKSCTVLKELGPGIQWVHSYVTGNKIYCIYKAENEAIIREHGKKGGFPVTSITEISSTISPATAQQ